MLPVGKPGLERFLNREYETRTEEVSQPGVQLVSVLVANTLMPSSKFLNQSTAYFCTGGEHLAFVADLKELELPVEPEDVHTSVPVLPALKITAYLPAPGGELWSAAPSSTTMPDFRPSTESARTALLG